MKHGDGRLGPCEARKIALQAGARDVMLVESYLNWCSDKEDGLRTIDTLRTNCPWMFLTTQERLDRAKRSTLQKKR